MRCDTTFPSHPWRCRACAPGVRPIPKQNDTLRIERVILEIQKRGFGVANMFLREHPCKEWEVDPGSRILPNVFSFWAMY